MSFGLLGTVCLLVYLVLLVGLAEYARRSRKDSTPSDHFLAGRELGFFVLLLTLYATTYSGNSLLGYPGEGYRRGYAWIISTGMMMSLMVGYQILIPKLRPLSVRENFVTPGDWVLYRYGKEGAGLVLRSVLALLMVVALGNYLLAQLQAMGHVTGQVTNGLVPYSAAVIGLAGFILIYETVGGMRAVAWTDAVQGVLMLLGLGLMLYWISQGEGFSELVRKVGNVRPSAIAAPSDMQRINWISTILLVGIGAVMYPQAIQRIFAARSSASLRRALVWMGFLPLTTTFVVMLLGIAAIPRFSDLGTLEADRVMPMLLAQWAATGVVWQFFAVLVFVAALAAIMSTADSVLLSLGSIIAGDVLGRNTADPKTTKTGKRAAMVVMLIALGFALFPTLSLWRLTELKLEILVQAAPAFMVGIHWKKFKAKGALVGIGIGVFIALVALVLDVRRIWGLHVGVVAVAFNFAFAVFFSCILPADRPREETP